MDTIVSDTKPVSRAFIDATRPTTSVKLVPPPPPVGRDCYVTEPRRVQVRTDVNYYKTLRG